MLTDDPNILSVTMTEINITRGPAGAVWECGKKKKRKSRMREEKLKLSVFL